MGFSLENNKQITCSFNPFTNRITLLIIQRPIIVLNHVFLDHLHI